MHNYEGLYSVRSRSECGGLWSALWLVVGAVTLGRCYGLPPGLVLPGQGVKSLGLTRPFPLLVEGQDSPHQGSCIFIRAAQPRGQAVEAELAGPLALPGPGSWAQVGHEVGDVRGASSQRAQATTLIRGSVGG